MEREKEGFPITSLREINTLLISQHPNVVTVREIVVGSNTDKIYIVMDFVEHDMKSLMETMRKKNHGKIIFKESSYMFSAIAQNSCSVCSRRGQVLDEAAAVCHFSPARQLDPPP